MTALSQTADDYLQLRRALGHKLADAGRRCPSRCLPGVQRPPDDHHRGRHGVGATTRRRPNQHRLGESHAVARGLARYLAAMSAHPGASSRHPVRSTAPARSLHLFAAEIASLMAASGLTIRSEFRAATIETLFGLLAATGMRVGEAIRTG